MMKPNNPRATIGSNLQHLGIAFKANFFTAEMAEKATATKIESISVTEDDEIDVFSLHLRGTTGKANKHGKRWGGRLVEMTIHRIGAI